jgi:hypothetical protein
MHFLCPWIFQQLCRKIGMKRNISQGCAWFKQEMLVKNRHTCTHMHICSSSLTSVEERLRVVLERKPVALRIGQSTRLQERAVKLHTTPQQFWAKLRPCTHTHTHTHRHTHTQSMHDNKRSRQGICSCTSLFQFYLIGYFMVVQYGCLIVLLTAVLARNIGNPI